MFLLLVFFFFFFFQAEDGIRDLYVTGVQTCALPIWHRAAGELRSALSRWLARCLRRPRATQAHRAGAVPAGRCGAGSLAHAGRRPADRKSTRLNSSHVEISYAVFCLKKKTNASRLD